jgi:ubiquinone/menaquinone biosynthesis C-methylase UbiE
VIRGGPLNPPSDLKQQVVEGFTQAADAYDATGVEFFRQTGARLAGMAGLAAGMRALDVGCGKGAVTIPAAEAVGPSGHVTGIDLADPMLKYAAAEARRRGLRNVTFRRGDAEDPPFPGGVFDAVLVSNVIQFLPRPADAARRYRALLAPGGVLALSWSLSQDPRWVPVMAAVDAHVPDGTQGFEPFLRRKPFNSEAEMMKMLAGCRYTDISITTEDVTTRFASMDQWWAGCQSQAPWAVSWRHIPDHDAARQAAFRILETLRDDTDGTFTRVLRFGYATARNPQGAETPQGPWRGGESL